MADEHYSSFINAPRINDSIRQRIISWIDAGALPPQTTFSQATQEPMAEENFAGTGLYTARQHTITSNTDSYQCFVIDMHLQKDTFVKAIRYHSTNPATVHHIMVYLDTLHVLDTLPDCWNCMKDGIVNKLMPLDSWSKGMQPCIFTKDFAFHFPKGAKFLLQIHYGNEGNKGQVEQTSLEVFFEQRPERIVKYEILNNLKIHFPANTVKTETIRFHTDTAISMVGIVPHMHFLAKRAEVFAITPALEKIHLLKINDWDYSWQGSYLLKSLVPVPAGSTIYMNVVFDNTDKNPKQPNNPIKDVKYDTYSNEEMMVLALYMTNYKTGDGQQQPYRILRHQK
jgi:hypothetical protein